MQNQSRHNITASNEIFLSEGISIFPELGEIVFGSKKIRISPNNMRVLKVLLVNSQQVVSREKIFDSVWNNQVISDDTLTRCISDLRSQLKILSSSQKLIETIPKKGYRWLLEVSMEPEGSQQLIEPHESSIDDVDSDLNDIKNIESLKSSKKGYHFGIWMASLFVSLILLIILVFSSVTQILKGQQVRVALFQHDISNSENAIVANYVEDKLKAKLLATKNIRFLSSSIINKHKQNIYPRLSREFSIQWIIEVRLRNTNGKLSLSLYLVDARTGIVQESLSTNIKLKQLKVDPLIDQFILLLTANSD